MKSLKLLLIASILLIVTSRKLTLAEEDEEPEMKQYEKDHIEFLRKNAAECTLFLNRNDAFPIKKPGTVLLVGSGARNTLKGGGGSGDVESRFYTTCEEGLENQGFEIVSKDWLDEFPSFKKKNHPAFVKNIFTISDFYQSNAGHCSFGAVEPEYDYDLPLDYEADIAIYVVSRNSSEGDDRKLRKGDIMLTDSEVRDILKLDKEFEKFMLVLNVVGVVDLSPVKDVSNILLLSQLGVVTGDILADIILGKTYPSGKLATTWASVRDYRYIEEFGNVDNTRYLEGVYVGYRYFDSTGVKPLYAFGYGKGYTDFKFSKESVTNKEDIITVKVNVKNVGEKFPGKEVIQVYVSPSQKNKDKPYQSLVAFKKTKELEPDEEESLSIKFSIKDVARYDEKKASYILDKGKYIIRVGTSSDKTKVFAYASLSEDVVLEKLTNIGGKPDFQDFVPPEIAYKDDLSEVQEIDLDEIEFSTKTVKYEYKPTIYDEIKELSNEDLGKVCVCNFEVPGHLFGEAGETVQTIKDIKNHLVLADGPAGLRLVRKYGVDEKGPYRLFANPMEARLGDYLSKEELATFDSPENNKDRDGDVFYQFTTAIPIATALAQTFNEDLLEKIGDLVGNEMDIFGVNLWLAPGLNIHRNIQCGRNFEYFSEDPLISGKMAGAITRGVQSHKNRATTIKHLACNGQEFNRFNSNSVVSERALREIYLKGFQIAIKDSNPYTLMTSYNLINGIHSSERKDLIIDVVRTEWKYEGLIMSDWFTSGTKPIGAANLKSQFAVNNIRGGNNLQMGGGKNDYDLIMQALNNGELSKERLLECASKVYEVVELLNKSKE
ncbi:MAG: glycoside hydrolase family 3 C-terminal domain-containing protein [archaeon]|nr:glycoside hydrolase family 3 C-terminal domain-containing protein [archaeon]